MRVRVGVEFRRDFAYNSVSAAAQEGEYRSIVSTPKETSEAEIVRASLESQLSLAKRISKGLGRCAQELSNNGRGSATYLWVCVSKDGISDRACDGETSRLTVDEWLNVVDEAASIGVSRFVVSAKRSLSDFPDIWRVCEWAQDTHGMVVVLHTNAAKLSQDELTSIRALDPEKTRMLLTEQAMPSAKGLETEGIVLCPVDKGPLDCNPCEKPGKMVFVNPEGTLYTCGLVEGLADFHLGDVFDGTLLKVMKNPDLPHAVADQERFFAKHHACDGCPALAKDIFEDEA